MKRLFCVAAIILIPLVLLGQTRYEQNKNLAREGWDKDPWYFFDQTESHVSENIYFYVNQPDTARTDRYYIYPFMYFESTSADTNTAEDSIHVKIDLWASERPATSTFKFVKTLLWNNSDGTITNSTTIETADEWWCDPGVSSYPGLTYFRLEIVPLAKNRKTLTGVRFALRGIGHILPK